jgi:hypothetical protein
MLSRRYNGTYYLGVAVAILRAGHDLFNVVKGSTVVNLDSLFPGAGNVYSDGVPIDPVNLGNFTTGLIRKADLPEGESGAVPIIWFAEHSVSTHPVNLAPFGLGEGNADYHTIINLGGVLPYLPNTDGLVRPSEGVMTIHRSRVGGGRFDLVLNINPLIVLTKVGGRPFPLNGPDVIKVIDGSGILNPVRSIGGQWSEVSHKTRSIQNDFFQTGGSYFAALDRITAEPIAVELTSGGLFAERIIQAATMT